MHPKACLFRRTISMPRNTHQGHANFDLFISFVLTKNPLIMVAAAGLGLIQTIPKHRLTYMDPNRSKALAPAPFARPTTTLNLITSKILTKSSPI